MPKEEADFVAILKTLKAHKVDYIVVGGLCAVLNGAPVHTYDLDIVPLQTPDNLKRMEAALLELQACYREQLPKRLIPEAEKMTTDGHHLFSTVAGPLDVLGAIAGKRDYSNLLPNTFELQIEEGIWVRLLTLRMLIVTKRETARNKDKLALPILLRTLEELERKGE